MSTLETFQPLIIQFLTSTFLIWVASWALKYPKKDVVSAIKTGVIYNLGMFSYAFLGAMLLYPLTIYLGSIAYSMVLAIIMIPLHMAVLAYVIRAVYKTDTKKAVVSGVMIAMTSLVAGFLTDLLSA